MQFHLNGFRTGDPSVSDVAENLPAYASGSLPQEVDVLIVGCGPAGLTLAAQLSAFPEIATRIVEQKPGPLELGQADGIACRTIEMFDAFGFSENVLKESYWVNETVFWKPDAAQPGAIVRSGRILDVEEGLSEFPPVILNQARVHDFFLDVMRRSPSRLEPDYSRRLLDLEIDDASSHPVTVRLERIDPAHQGEIETVRARYVVGCDGARSIVRKSIGRALHGDSANQAAVWAIARRGLTHNSVVLSKPASSPWGLAPGERSTTSPAEIRRQSTPRSAAASANSCSTVSSSGRYARCNAPQGLTQTPADLLSSNQQRRESKAMRYSSPGG